MLADLRFVLGAVLAVTLLAVIGLGMVTSVALMREAHVRPIEDSRSLAYAGPLGRNEFYDPDGTWRSASASAPATQIEAPTAVAPAEAPEQIASIPPSPPAAEAAPVITEEPVIAKENEPTTEAAVTAPARSPSPLETVTPPEAPPAAEPAASERLASAPAIPPVADPPSPSQASPEASVATLEVQPPPAVSSADLPPMPRPRPQPRKHIARARRAPAAPTQSAPDPTAAWAPWPFFGPPPATASAANRSPANREQ